MPKDDTVQPAVSSQQPAVSTPPPVLEDIVLPPMVSADPKASDQKLETNSGSAAPSNDVIVNTTPISTMPRKKYAGGKIIATILGLFLLVGGLGAGVYLTGQNQNINEQAGCFSDCIATPGNTPGECNAACGNSWTNNGFCGNGDCDSGENANNCRADCYSEEIPETPPQICTPGRLQERSCAWLSNTTTCGGTMTEICSGDGTTWNAQTACRDIVGDSCGDIATAGCGPSDVNALNGSCTNIKPSEDCISGNTVCTTTQYCHCQGGVQCTVGVCVAKTNFDTACIGDGRVVASNPINPGAKTCCDHGYVAGPNGEGCVLPPTTGGGGTPSNPPAPTPTAPPVITASCQNIKAYSTDNWSMIPAASLSSLKGGQDSVNFCVAGALTGGSFDKARFTINGSLQTETTTVRPNSADFCQLYNLPAGVTSYNVTAEIHHVTLGWK